MGFGLDPTASSGKPYHDFITFVVTGNATIQSYFGTKNAWWLNTVGTVAFPITIPEGGYAGAYVFDQAYSTLPTACADAASKNLTLFITVPHTALTTQVFNCQVQFVSSGIVQPAAGRTLTFSHLPTCPGLQQCFDASLGGAGSILVNGPVPFMRPEWFGAVPQPVSGSLSGGGAVNSAAFAAVQRALPVLRDQP